MALNNGNEKTFVLPSLLKSAYRACDANQRKKYDEMQVMSADLEWCCESLFILMQFNSDVKYFQPLGDRRSMFHKIYNSVICSLPDDHYNRLCTNICEIAASHGHIDCMKFAHAIGVPWVSPNYTLLSACDEAAKSGNLECLKYAHVNGSRWNKQTTSFAAGNGHLDCLMYLHDNGCPWDEQSCCEAAIAGEFDCLKYAIDNGCPWDASVCYIAADRKHYKCLRYAYEKKCDWNNDIILSTLSIFNHFNWFVRTCLSEDKTISAPMK